MPIVCDFVAHNSDIVNLIVPHVLYERWRLVPEEIVALQVVPIGRGSFAPPSLFYPSSSDSASSSSGSAPQKRNRLVDELDFAIIGFPRSGTTTLSRSLRKLPGVSLGAEEDEHLWNLLRRFPSYLSPTAARGCESDSMCGAKMPLLIWLPDILRQVASANKKLKIIINVRDVHQWMRSWTDFERFKLTDSDDYQFCDRLTPDLFFVRPHFALLSHYIKQVIEIFGDHRVLLLDFDELKARPHFYFNRLCSFLEISDHTCHILNSPDSPVPSPHSPKPASVSEAASFVCPAHEHEVLNRVELERYALTHQFRRVGGGRVHDPRLSSDAFELMMNLQVDRRAMYGKWNCRECETSYLIAELIGFLGDPLVAKPDMTNLLVAVNMNDRGDQDVIYSFLSDNVAHGNVYTFQNRFGLRHDVDIIAWVDEEQNNFVWRRQFVPTDFSATISVLDGDDGSFGSEVYDGEVGSGDNCCGRDYKTLDQCLVVYPAAQKVSIQHGQFAGEVVAAYVHGTGSLRQNDRGDFLLARDDYVLVLGAEQAIGVLAESSWVGLLEDRIPVVVLARPNWSAVNILEEWDRGIFSLVANARITIVQVMSGKVGTIPYINDRLEISEGLPQAGMGVDKFLRQLQLTNFSRFESVVNLMRSNWVRSYQELGDRIQAVSGSHASLLYIGKEAVPSRDDILDGTNLYPGFVDSDMMDQIVDFFDIHAPASIDELADDPTAPARKYLDPLAKVRPLSRYDIDTEWLPILPDACGCPDNYGNNVSQQILRECTVDEVRGFARDGSPSDAC